MHTEPEIITTPDLSVRSYVKVYIDGERNRFYNGKELGLKCHPNHARTVSERDRALNELCYQLKRKLEKGWKPGAYTAKAVIVVSAGQAFTDLKPKIEEENLSKIYERGLLSVNEKFIKYLKTNQLDKIPIGGLATENIEVFLDQFKSSPTNYMNRRRELSALFFRLKTKKVIQTNPTQETSKQKEVAHLNLPYKKEQLRKVLDVVKERHNDLYLCCLLMYGCLLRPHQEIRLLRRGSFDEGFTKISLGGRQNKSRRIRTVVVPEFVRTELIRLGISELEDGQNIFSHTIDVFNPYYFSTAWGRIKEDLLETGLIEQDHTLYSFRHTSAVFMYLKTKDPYKIQQAFGHSSLRVTLIYLRSLGMIVNASLDDLPELPL